MLLNWMDCCASGILFSFWSFEFNSVIKSHTSLCEEEHIEAKQSSSPLNASTNLSH